MAKKNLDEKIKVKIHLNEADEVVAIFSRKHSHVASLNELEYIFRDVVCGFSATKEDFLLFFPAGTLAVDVFRTIYSIDGVIDEITTETEVVPYWPAIPIVDGVVVDYLLQ